MFAAQDLRENRARRVVDAIAAWTVEHGYGPSMTELAAHFGGVSTSTVKEWMDWAVELGMLVKPPRGVARGYRVIEGNGRAARD